VIRNRQVSEEQPVFKLFPELQEWPTKGMFCPDPYRAGFWSYRGRVDDLLILSNGSTVNPAGYEESISKIACVKQAIMCATGGQKPALLVELEPSSPPDSRLLDELWMTAKESNRVFPPRSSVERSHIIITSPDKPLPRSAKGTVQRALALEVYREELERLYL